MKPLMIGLSSIAACTIIATAGEQGGELLGAGAIKPNTEIEKQLSEALVMKRNAAFQISIALDPDDNGQKNHRYSWGVFVSADGLALVDLTTLCHGKKVHLATHDGSPLDFGEILGIFPDQMVALMRFDHQPKQWLRVASEEPEIGEKIALVTLSMGFMFSDAGDRPILTELLPGPIV